MGLGYREPGGAHALPEDTHIRTPIRDAFKVKNLVHCRLVKFAKVGEGANIDSFAGLHCLLAHKYDSQPVPCTVTMVENRK